MLFSLRRWIILLVWLPFAGHAQRTALPRARPGATIPALLVSDIHFDPFHDPSKAEALNDAPASGWAAILSAADAANQPQAFAALQKSCRARGADTPYALLRSSLGAMRRQVPLASFITVSGDLVVHDLPCRYRALLPGQSQASYEAFVEKTMQFVVEQLSGAFPAVPVYVAPGNNDSGCGDYHMDPDSAFLKAAAQIVASAAPAADRHTVEEQFRHDGSYSVPLAPLRGTRLIVLNDLFLSPEYASCKGQPNTGPAEAELGWLAHQLDEAQKAGEHVWVMAHIPPGVNAFETVRRFKNLCSGEAPEMFLVPADSARLDKILLEHAGAVRLALFGHTHMDEMRSISLLEGAANNGRDSGAASSAGNISVKLVPSISPIDGNQPSFTVAQVEYDGTLKDYSVMVASNLTGNGTAWSQEYDYGGTYHEPDFSSASVTRLISVFRGDPRAQNPASQAYIRHYYKGKASSALAPFWPEYECSLNELTPQGYSHCICALQK